MIFMQGLCPFSGTSFSKHSYAFKSLTKGRLVKRQLFFLTAAQKLSAVSKQLNFKSMNKPNTPLRAWEHPVVDPFEMY